MSGATRARVLAGALAAAAVAAGCGGGLSADEFRREAGRLCSAEDRAANDAGVEGARSAAQLADALDRARRQSRPIQAQFAELEPPGELEDAHADYVALNRDGDRLLERTIRGLRGSEQAAAAAVTELQRSADGLTRRSTDLARRLGAPACGEGEGEG